MKYAFLFFLITTVYGYNKSDLDTNKIVGLFSLKSKLYVCTKDNDSYSIISWDNKKEIYRGSDKIPNCLIENSDTTYLFTILAGNNLGNLRITVTNLNNGNSYNIEALEYYFQDDQNVVTLTSQGIQNFTLYSFPSRKTIKDIKSLTRIKAYREPKILCFFKDSNSVYDLSLKTLENYKSYIFLDETKKIIPINRRKNFISINNKNIKIEYDQIMRCKNFMNHYYFLLQRGKYLVIVNDMGIVSSKVIWSKDNEYGLMILNGKIELGINKRNAPTLFTEKKETFIFEQIYLNDKDYINVNLKDHVYFLTRNDTDTLFVDKYMGIITSINNNNTYFRVEKSGEDMFLNENLEKIFSTVGKIEDFEIFENHIVFLCSENSKKYLKIIDLL